MKERKSRTVGSGITRREELAPIPWNKEFAHDLVDAFKGMRIAVSRPWGVAASAIEMARIEYDRLEADLAERHIEYEAYNAHFKAHDSYGWYLRRIVQFSGKAEELIDAGSPLEALEYALLVGEAIMEFRTKESWGSFVEKALDVKRSQVEGAKSRAKHPKYLRYSSVLIELDKGISKSQAFQNVAKDLGVSVSTVRDDYYSERSIYGR
jgi:hypothetical protein